MSTAEELQQLIATIVRGQGSLEDLSDWLADHTRTPAPDEHPAPPARAAPASPWPGTGGPAAKTFRGGTHRAVTPEETVARVRRFMPAMGITRIADVTGLDCIGVPVVMVCRPNSRSLAVSQGKGLTLAAAQASGLMESVEAYHAERITLPLKLANHEEMRASHRVADVRQLPRAAGSRFRRDLPLLWIEGHDLLQDEPVWLPYEMAHTNYTLPPPIGSGCFVASSNGLASGNHLLEALSHAICEVVERDATTLWLLAGADVWQRTRVDLATIDDPDCCVVLERLDRAGVAVGVWEVTSDVGIPAFACTIVERTADPLRALVSASGMGCHPVRGIALLRALTEAIQSRLTLIAGSREDVSRDEYRRSRNPDTLQRERAVVMGERSTRRFQDAPTWEAETFDEDIAWELDRLRAAGLTSVLAVDLSKPEFGVPVARVVIPSLESSTQIPAYAPGARARAILRGRA